MSRLVLFLGSTRDGRNGARVASHLVKLLKEKKHAVTVFGKPRPDLHRSRVIFTADLASPHRSRAT